MESGAEDVESEVGRAAGGEGEETGGGGVEGGEGEVEGGDEGGRAV